MASGDEIEGVDLSQFDKAEIYTYAVKLHLDMMAYMEAGFTRDEAFELVRGEDQEFTSFVYGVRFHNETGCGKEE